MSTIYITSPEAVTYGGNTVLYAGETVTFRTLQVPTYLLNDTLVIEDSVDARSTAAFDAFFPNGDNAFIIGDQIKIASDSTVLFGGVIDGMREREDEHGRLFVHITAVDYTALLDRHVIAAAYTNQTTAQIIDDIVTSSTVSTLHRENLSTVGVTDTTLVAKITFNYTRASEALAELATLAGATWTVTPDKDVVFQQRAANAAPYAITEAGANYRRLRVGRDHAEYRNRQYLRAGKDLTSSRTESFTGDGDLQTFTLAYPVGTAPTITVNGTAQSVGIRGLDTGLAWYWNKDDRAITQDDSGTRLTSTDTLAVTYQGLFPILVVVDNVAEQNARAAREGTSGYYVDVQQDASIDDRAIATIKAESLLARYGSLPALIEYETDDIVNAQALGARAGDIVTITKSAHGLTAAACLIESISYAYVDDTVWRINVRALTGNQTTSWLRYWRALAQEQQGLSVRENEVIIVGGSSTAFTDAVAMTDAVTATAAAPESRAGFATVGFSEAA